MTHMFLNIPRTFYLHTDDGHPSGYLRTYFVSTDPDGHFTALVSQVRREVGQKWQDREQRDRADIMVLLQEKCGGTLTLLSASAPSTRPASKRSVRPRGHLRLVPDC